MGVCKIAHPMLEATDVFFVFIVDKWKSIWEWCRVLKNGNRMDMNFVFFYRSCFRSSSLLIYV